MAGPGRRIDRSEDVSRRYPGLHARPDGLASCCVRDGRNLCAESRGAMGVRHACNPQKVFLELTDRSIIKGCTSLLTLSTKFFDCATIVAIDGKISA